MANKNKHISHIKSNVSVNSYVSKTDSSVVITSEQYEKLSSSEKENYILKAEPKLPSALDILYGEIAVNYKDDVETLSIKNDNDEIVEFASKKYVSKLVPTPTSLDTDKFLKGDGTWDTPPSISYPKGTAQDLDTGTDTAEKVWDAKTIADYVQDTVNALPEPMVFKGTLGTGGTISSLPEASSTNEGFTYKVITDGKYAGQKAKIGDLFISNGTEWNLVPSGDEPSGTVTNVATGTGLTGGPITTSGTISHADTSSQASVSNSGRTYIQSVTLDGMGHVTGLSSATETVVNTDRYVNNAAFADDSASAPASPVKMTLTRAGSDTETVTANLPKVSSASAGVAPKGAAVTTQSQSTKFLREDGNWAAPSYTKPGGDVTGPSSSTDAHVAVFNGGTGKVIKDSGFTIAKSVPSDAAFTDTQVTSAANHYAPAEDTSSQLDADASSTTAATWNSTSLVTGVTVKRDAKGHVVGLGVDSIKMPANPNTDTKVTSVDNHYAPATVSGQDKSASASGGTAGWSVDVVKGVTLNTDGKGHVTGLSVTSAKIPANPVSPNTVTGTGLKVDKIVVGNEGSKVKTSDKGITATAPSSSSDDSTVPTSKAVWTAVSNGIATADAMIYKGTVAGGSTGTYGALTPAANKGWTYKVATAGKIDGKAVEIGDMLICNTDGTAAATSSNYSTIVANWDFIQVNIDGAVTGPASSTDAHVVTFNGATGKVIKDSGFTIAKSVPSNAVFTDTQVTSAANHYAPAEDTSSQLDADASSTTAATWDSTSLVTGVTVKRDAKGHVVGLGVDSVKMPANPNTDIHATQRLNVNNGNYPILTSAVSIADTTADITAITLRNNSIYANPSTGTITANRFNGILSGTIIRNASVTTVSSPRWIWIKIGTFAWNAKGMSRIFFDGEALRDCVEVKYESGRANEAVNAKGPTIVGHAGTNSGNVSHLGIIYGDTWNGEWEMWVRVYQATTLSVKVVNLLGDSFTVNTETDWSATTTSPTFSKKITLIHGLFGDLSGNASSASKLRTDAGSATQPVYFSEGVPTACSYQLNKTVPSNAVFTDTHVTQRLDTGNANRPLLFSRATTEVTTLDSIDMVYRNNSIYANPSTGTITANKFNGSATHAETSSQSGFVENHGDNLEHYWMKLWEIDVNAIYVDRDVTFLLQSAFLERQGTLHVKIRQNGVGDFRISMRLTSGNIIKNSVRLYYNNSTGNCQLWYDCEAQYGCVNAKMLHKTFRYSNEVSTLGTMYSTATAEQQTLPGTGYEYVEPTYAVITEWGNIQNRPSLGTADTLSTGISTTENTWSAAVLNAAIGTGATTATSVTNVPITNRVVVVTISSGGAGPFTFALDSGLTKGREVHVIVKNTGSSDYTIAIPHSPDATSGYKYINTVDNAQGNIVVPKESGGYVEINALYDGTYVYLRYA